MLAWPAFFLVLSILTFVATATPSFQQCTRQHQLSYSSGGLVDAKEHLSGFIVCEGAVIDANSPLLTAIATIFVAGFTLTLWRATDRLWRAGEKALRTTERAFVFIDGFNVELTTAADAKTFELTDLPERYRDDPGLFITRFAVQPRWKNAGNSPTKRMTVLTNWRGPPGPIPPEYVFSSAPEPFFLAPKGVEPSGDFIEMNQAALLIDWANNPMGVEPMFWIWGRADYEDVFGCSHFIEWCYRLRFERHDGKALRAHFIQWGDYNRSDEDMPK